MKRLSLCLGALLAFCLAGAARAGAEELRASTGVPRMLLEAVKKSFGTAVQGQPVSLTFQFQNSGGADLVIYEAKPTCGCTAALTSSGPFRPGEGGSITLTYDTRGKVGHAYKDVRIFSNDPTSPITIALEGVVAGSMHPARDPGDTLFSGSCAECHALPARGKSGKELYDAVCALCHESPKKLAAPARAMAGLKRSALKKMTGKGVPGSSMPGFLHSSGGPLSKDQVESLTDYIQSLRD